MVFMVLAGLLPSWCPLGRCVLPPPPPSGLGRCDWGAGADRQHLVLNTRVAQTDLDLKPRYLFGLSWGFSFIFQNAGFELFCKQVYTDQGRYIRNTDPQPWWKHFFFVYFFGGLECVGHSFAYVAHLWFLRDVGIPTQSAAVASWSAIDLATLPSKLKILYQSILLTTGNHKMKSSVMNVLQ